MVWLKEDLLIKIDTPSIRYVNKKGLFKGVKENKFDVKGGMTRGMIVEVLYRLSDEKINGMSKRVNESIEGDLNVLFSHLDLKEMDYLKHQFNFIVCFLFL